jgi:hypothetical protein
LEIGDSLLDRFRAAPAVAQRLTALETEVMAGTQTPAAAARSLLSAFFATASGTTARSMDGRRLTRDGRAP